MTFAEQAAQLARNQVTMRAQFEQATKSAYRAIDKATSVSGGPAPRAKLAPDSIHDLAQRNPLLMRLLRDLQR